MKILAKKQGKFGIFLYICNDNSLYFNESMTKKTNSYETIN